MPLKLFSATDSIQESFAPHSPTPSSVVASSPMPQVEHQRSQRHIQLSDLTKHDRVDGESKSGRLSSREWVWVHNFFRKRRAKKGTRSANIDSAGKSPLERQKISRKSSHSHPKRTGLRKIRNDPKVSAAWQMPTADVKNFLQSEAFCSNERLTPLPTPKASQKGDDKPSNTPTTAAQSPFLKDGEVIRHEIRISQPSEPHRSIHLAHTASNNYQAKLERKDRSASHATTWGEFLRTPLKEVDEEIRLPWPKSPFEEEQPRAEHPEQAVSHSLRNTAFENNSILHSPPTLNPPTTSSVDTRTEPRECNLCGTPNSPCTRYGDHGIWLCTACRSPTTAIEVPPRKESIIGSTSFKTQPRLPYQATVKAAATDSQGCEDCNTQLLPFERDGFLFYARCCRQLTKATPKPDFQHSLGKSTPSRTRRQKSVPSVATQEAEEQWKNFDSEHSPQTKATTPSAAEKSDEHGPNTKTNQGEARQRPPVRLKPTPPLKDSIYLSRKLSLFSLNEAISPPPPVKDSPPPPSQDITSLSIETSWTPNRPSFIPDSPTLGVPPPTYPPPPPPSIPKHSQQQHSKSHARRPSSFYPPTSNPNLNPFAAEVQNFPYPPPPIPKDDYVQFGRRDRSSSVYPDDDPAPRLDTPDWERSPNRNTSFYDYWEVILSEHGRRGTVGSERRGRGKESGRGREV